MTPGHNAARRADRHLRQLRRRYPDAVATLTAMSTWDDVAWPRWCWLPMAAAASYLPTVGLRDPADIARMTALATWRLTRGVYVPDPDVGDTAAERVRAGILDPGRAMTSTGLPQYCCYVINPAPAPDDADTRWWPAGVYVHIEHDINTAAPELRILVDYGGGIDALIPIYLDLTRDSVTAALAQTAGITGPADPAADPRSAAQHLLYQIGWAVLPLAVVLVDPDARITDDAGRSPDAPVPDQTGRIRGATAAHVWRITYDRPTLRPV